MNVRDTLFSLHPGQRILVNDNNYHVLITRNQNGSFAHRIVFDYPVFGSPEQQQYWLAMNGVGLMLPLNGAVFFLEGFNAGMENPPAN